MTAPTLGRIHLYPLKGFDPLPVGSARLLPSGALENDRRWAFVDSRGRFVNGKNYTAIHSIRAVFSSSLSSVALNGGRPLPIGPPLESAVSGLLGEPVTLRENATAGFPDDTDSPGPTLVSAASLDAVRHWFNLDSDTIRLRFRTNLEVEGIEPFWEDSLYGALVHIGAAAQLHVVNPCQRCVVPSRHPHTGLADPGFQKQFAELRRRHLPPDVAQPALFTHYYRFAVNTRLASGAGVIIRAGDELHRS